MRILIAEDDILISENLAVIVKSMNHTVANIVQSYKEFDEELKGKSFDFALLDIRMNGKDVGIEMADDLNDMDIPFVFITSFSDKNTLQNAISCRPHGFILKPFKRSEVVDVIEGVNIYDNQDALWTKCAGEMVKIYHDDIKYIQSDNVYVTIFTLNQRIVTRAKLNNLIEKLPSEKFIRTHQSYIVNIGLINRLSDNEIFLENEIRIPVSRKHQKALREVFS